MYNGILNLLANDNYLIVNRTLMKELGLDLPGITLVKEIYEEAMDLDLGKLDFSSTFEVVSRKED